MELTLRRVLCAFALLAFATLSLRASDDDLDIRKKLDKAMSKVYPALVQIKVVTVVYYNGREQKFEAAGSGAIITPEGHIITNHHVAGKAKQIRVRLNNLEELDATLVGTDPLADIAIVKIDPAQRKDQGSKLPTAEFGDSDKLKVGDRVFAMGCPIALSQSITMGIVSNTRMIIPGFFWPFTFKLDGEEVGTLVKWIGHDAQIYPGNSGGPLVDVNGKLVGINEISLGLGGAIPGNLAKEVADQIIEHGHVSRSYTGIQVQPLLQGSSFDKGALISAVMKDSPAETAGLKAGDILTTYGGDSVSIRFPEEIPEFNRRQLFTKIGESVPVEVLRDGKQMKLTLTTTTGEAARGDEHELSAWGITARQLTKPAAQELKRTTTTGAFVWSVRPGGPAGDAKPSIRSEDVIVSVNDTPINGLAQLEEITASIVKGQEKPVPALVGFERKGERLMTVVKLGLSVDDDKGGEMNKPWLPCAYQVLTADLSEALKLKGACGVRLTQVYPNSSAEEAGLKPGDIITKVDGDAVQCTQPEDIEVLDQMLRQYKIGTEAELTVLRSPGYASATVKMKLTARPKPSDQMKKYKDTSFDFEVRDLTYMDRVREQWPTDQAGAMVSASEPGGWAALAHLGVNDLILSVDEIPVTAVSVLKTHMEEVAKNKPRHVVFFIKRGIHTMFIEMEPIWK